MLFLPEMSFLKYPWICIVQLQKIVYTTQFQLLNKVLYHFRIFNSYTFTRAIKHFGSSSRSEEIDENKCPRKLQPPCSGRQWKVGEGRERQGMVGKGRGRQGKVGEDRGRQRKVEEGRGSQGTLSEARGRQGKVGKGM